MSSISPLFLASLALLAEATAGASTPATQDPSSVAIPPHTEAQLTDQAAYALRHRRERLGWSLLAPAFLIATFSMVFLILQCRRALLSSKSSSLLGVNNRKLADGGRDPCDVRTVQQNQAIKTPVDQGMLDSRAAGIWLRANG